MNEQIQTIIDRARALLAAATQGPVAVYPHPRPRQDHDESRFQWGDLVTGGRSMWTMIPMADAEALAFAVNNLGAICDALEAAERRAEEAEALLRDQAAAMTHGLRNELRMLGERNAAIVERDAMARRAEEAEARVLEDEQLRLRLAGDLAMEKRQHETTRGRLEEAHKEVDGLRAERASVDAGVCQSCSSAWWAREHDQQAAKEQVAAAEAALRAERVRASEAQMTTNAAVRDLASAAGEVVLLREKLTAAEAERAALRDRAGIAEGREAAAKANAEQMAGWLDARNAGLVQMARERDALRVKLAAAEAKAARLKSPIAKVCRCVNTTYAFDPARAVVLPLAGYSITAGVGCQSCGGSGAVIVEGAAQEGGGAPRAPRVTQDRPWNEYPLGTLAHACNGGAWLRVADGWQWNGHRPNPGSTFPTPGGDAVGACVELPTEMA